MMLPVRSRLLRRKTHTPADGAYPDAEHTVTVPLPAYPMRTQMETTVLQEFFNAANIHTGPLHNGALSTPNGSASSQKPFVLPQKWTLLA